MFHKNGFSNRAFRRWVALIVTKLLLVSAAVVSFSSPAPAVPPRLACSAAEEEVLRMYPALFARDADTGGAKNWLALYRQGMSLESIARDMAGSQEFTKTYQGTSDDEFVTRVYQNSLGRSPDPSGFENWVRYLGVRGRYLTAVTISRSVEAKQRHTFERTSCPPGPAPTPPERLPRLACSAAEEEVLRMYPALFARDADTGGARNWLAVFRSGSNLKQISESMSRSIEFQNTYGGSSDVDFVGRVYVNSLGRLADPAGLNGWVRHLQAHGYADTALTISRSEEAKKRHRFFRALCPTLPVRPPSQPVRPPSQPRPPSPAVAYKNCTDVWNRLGRPIYANDPGYSLALDRDGDGTGCETRPR